MAVTMDVSAVVSDLALSLWVSSRFADERDRQSAVQDPNLN
jgi:hypothetical protein